MRTQSELDFREMREMLRAIAFERLTEALTPP